jgi:prepilin-type N-terminal cleavage/methylation domain-containing protein
MPRSRRLPTGFTLVELLVVITIIGMLMALIFPAFGAFLANTRKSSCQNNMRQVAGAVRMFESKKQVFPGWSHRLQTRRGAQGSPEIKNVSWHVAILEYLQEADYRAFKFQQITTAPYLSIFVCPVDSPPSREAPTSYVANCGMKDASSGANMPPDWQYNGIFHREVSQSSNQKSVRFTSNDIKDPISRTLLITENVQADRWWAAGQEPQEANLGVVFFVDKGNPNEPLPATKKINNGFDDVPSPSELYNYARPSSNHSEGVCVAYADGSSGFLLDRVPYGDVYIKLMTPDGQRAMEAGTQTPLPQRLREPLDESLMQ